MVRQQRMSSEVLARHETATVLHAYELALLHIADECLAFEDAPPSDIKARMNSAILDAFRNGISDLELLKVAGIAAVVSTRGFEFDFLDITSDGYASAFSS